MNAKYQLIMKEDDPETYLAPAIRHGYKNFVFLQQFTELSGT